MTAKNTKTLRKEREYEVVQHGIIKNFKVFMVNLAYRTPHMHRDFELNFLLEGHVHVICDGVAMDFYAPDFFVINPFAPHEIHTESPALLLSMQVQPSFYKNYFPDISHTEFSFCSAKETLTHTAEGKSVYDAVFASALSMAVHYFKTDTGFSLYCAAKLNEIFYSLITSLPYETISAAEHRKQKQQYERVRRIASYIDEHYNEKLLLQDIAETEDLSLTYLSHFFKNHFQMSFQEYLMHLRCEKARQLLLLTDHNLLEISMECGFSDIKYLNKGFQTIYGTHPRDFRLQVSDAQPLPKKQAAIASTALQSNQQFLSKEDCLSILSALTLSQSSQS